MKKLTFLLVVALFLTACSSEPEIADSGREPVSYVNVFIGTGGHGHTYPGATAPFGMVQLSPDTRMDDWDGCSGYHYSDDHILGFSHTHLSGTGCNDYGDFRFMPVVGEKHYKSDEYRSAFRHETEVARPGYYSVVLDDYNIKVELASGVRAAIHRYYFPQGENASVILDLKESTLSAEKIYEAWAKVEGENAISGFRRSGYWARDQYIYFYAEFSKPIKKHDNTKDGLVHSFDFLNDGTPLLMRIGISAVDVEGAKKNLESEITDFDLDALAEKTYNQWNEELSRISVKSVNEKDKTVFYTALYHSFIVPNLYSDVDGRYRAHDLQVHQAASPRYTIFSQWDTFRTENPLLNIIQPKRSVDIINTFIDNYETGGLLPTWELAANETHCMIGYHSIPVFADAYVNGITGFDADKALAAMVDRANKDFFGLDCYKKYGYIAADAAGESVSTTLEYAYDDWCIAVMADKMGRQDVADEFYRRAQYYKNLYDPETKFFRGRKNGGFVTPFDPRQVNFMLTEANTWQYNFFAPQDVNTHIEMMGGNEQYGTMLSRLFSTSSDLTGRQQVDITGLIGQYAHGNEPSHHIAYLFNFIGKPAKTQKMVGKIMNELYTDQTDGLCGNEDCGQMSAWYVMSAMGFFPVTPACGYYVIGVPHFEKMTLNLENGKQFTIIAKNLSRENCFIESVRLNGKKLNRSYIYYNEIAEGGKLEFTMTSDRNTAWATKAKDCPVMRIDRNVIVTTPIITVDQYVFYDSLQVTITHPDKDAVIYYALDVNDPSEGMIRSAKIYDGPFVIKATTEVNAVAVVDLGDGQSHVSTVASGVFKKIDAGRTVTLKNNYSDQYAAGGDIALIDLQRGNDNFRVGTWQGFYGVDLVATVDLGEMTDITRLAGSFLQDQKSWIFMPEEVEFLISDDGKKFKSVGVVENEISPEAEEAVTQELEIRKKMKARYVRMVAKSIGNCPDWHVGAGEKSWIFCDEIVIE
ncbi:MAG: GH92 family glycosyl hydrolase [Bacteroidales bacterium]|nr:GH92 family glycosyl hydrolase [Bacteroidales bacterium]